MAKNENKRDINTQKRAMIDTFNNFENNKYYVYALCEKTKDKHLIPFYIGKGKDNRIWMHEEGYEVEKKYIEQNSSGDEKIIKIEELSEKYKKIDKLTIDNIEKIIIKWGMTEDEAFMAESALINLLHLEGFSYCAGTATDNVLTNIVNGHASFAEKELGKETKARNIDQFYNECSKKPIDLEELEEYDIILISINKGYMQCVEADGSVSQEAIRQIARGFWRVTDNVPKYLFAMYKQQVVGVFKIKKPENGKLNTVLDVWDDDYPMHDRISIRVEDKEFAQKIYRAYKNDRDVGLNPDYDTLDDELKKEVRKYLKIKETTDEIEVRKRFNSWTKRKYYVLEDVNDNDFLSKYLGSTILDDGKSPILPRSFCRYNKKNRNNKNTQN